MKSKARDCDSQNAVQVCTEYGAVVDLLRLISVSSARFLPSWIDARSSKDGDEIERDNSIAVIDRYARSAMSNSHNRRDGMSEGVVRTDHRLRRALSVRTQGQSEKLARGSATVFRADRMAELYGV